MSTGAAMAVLASLILLQGCWEVGAEIGGRHIRRITAADLPSSNSTEATKVRLKKTQVKVGENCTKEGSCMNAMTAAPHSNPKGKTTSSFLADDVLQGRLHADVLSFLTTTGSPYGGGYDSYFDGDIFGERTVSVPKKLSFSDVYRSATERMNYDMPLTTPRISLFDDFYAKVTEGIRQNLEEMDEYRFRDVSRFYDDNVQEGHRTAPVTVLPPSTADPADKSDEKVALEILSKLSVVYNDSKMSNSVRRDIVVENGTHVDFERSRIHTELQPEVNRTTFYISNDTHSTIIPAPTSVSMTDSRNGSQTFHNNAVVNHSSANELFLESLGHSEHSPHPNITISMNVIQNNNTGTPGNKDSTTSESKRDRTLSRSNGVRNNSSRDNITVISNKPIALQISNGTKSELIDTEKKNTTNNIITTSRSGAVVKTDSKSKAASPVSAERDNNRGSRMLVSSRSNYNSTNGLEQSSQTPISGSSENNFSSDNATRKPRTKYNLRRNGTNASEEQVESSTVIAGMTTRKAVPSVRVRADEKVTPQTKQSVRSRKNDTNPVSGYGFTEVPNDRSTTGSSRGRASTYQRPHTAASNTTSDSEAQVGKSDYSTVRPSTISSSVNAEMVRRRLTTLNRRLQSSTTTPVTLYTTNNSTTESNAIVRGLPVTVGRPPAIKNTPSNKTENNEGNDIVSFKNDAYKPVTRSRGSVRYGNQKNYTSGDIWNSSSVFSTPPTTAAWTLVSLSKTSNETQNLRQNNSTLDVHKRRWPPTRGRRPWSSEEQGKYLCLKIEWLKSFE